jgi:signal peptidase I
MGQREEWANRSPLFAAFAVLLAPGLGHAYAGNWRRGVVLWAGSIGWALTAIYLGTVLPTAFLREASIATIPLASLAVALDGAREARAAERPYRLQPCNHIGFYLAYVLAAIIVVAPTVGWGSRRWIAGAHRLPGLGMEPTLQQGDYLYVTPRFGDPVTRGEMVTAKLPSGIEVLFRVAGRPGDTIQLHDGQLTRNGQEVAEPYLRRTPAAEAAHSALPRSSYSEWGPIVVPAGHYVLLGDNRAIARDSREFGPVPDSSIIGRASWIYLSRRPTGGIRWARLGLRPR